MFYEGWQFEWCDCGKCQAETIHHSEEIKKSRERDSGSHFGRGFGCLYKNASGKSVTSLTGNQRGSFEIWE